MKISYLLFCIFLSSLITSAFSFTCWQPEHRVITKPKFVPYPELVRVKGRSLPTILYYRAHNEKDVDQLISKLRTRLAPIFQRSKISRPPVQPQSVKVKGINTTLIISLIVNQLIILAFAVGLGALFVALSGNQDFFSDGALNWSGKANAPSVEFDISITPLRFIQGALGAIPSIALSQKIEHSEDRKFATMNVSTTLMVMTLFGTRRRNVKREEKIGKMDKLLEPITKKFSE